VNTRPVRLRIRPTSGWQEYEVNTPPNAYVMDALEEAGAQDSSLLFRHSCHHASCGSCGIRINGREALPCVTPIKQFRKHGRALQLEPLRNFPIVGDLLVDLGPFLRKLDVIDLPLRRHAEPLGKRKGLERIEEHEPEDVFRLPTAFNRLENCIECGLCVSACPVAGGDPQYAGPALLAAAGRMVSEPRGRDMEEVISVVDREHGLWRCHAAFECSDVCPAGVDPAREIMSLRSELLRSPAKREPKGAT
jgi:succinate dehydrogenase / fumarate reductase iron-sulfur subunit